MKIYLINKLIANILSLFYPNFKQLLKMIGITQKGFVGLLHDFVSLCFLT